MNLGLIIKDKVMMKKLEQMQNFFSRASGNVLVESLGCLGTESKLFKSRNFREPTRSGSEGAKRSVSGNQISFKTVVEVITKSC